MLLQKMAPLKAPFAGKSELSIPENSIPPHCIFSQSDFRVAELTTAGELIQLRSKFL
jgi:hypothetical protein